MPESVTRRSSARAMRGSYVGASGGFSDDAAGPLDRVDLVLAVGLDVRADRLLRCTNVAGGEGLDDVPVLGDEVVVAFDVPAADDLHHQVDGQLAVEARQERVPGEVDLVLVESGVRCIPLLV